MKTIGRTLLPACAALCVATTVCQPASAATRWTATATQGIPLSRLVSASDLGALSVSTPLTIRVGLQVQSKNALLSYVKALSSPQSPLYGQFLTPQQFAAKYAPTQAQVQQVVSYLKQAGFSNIVVEPNNLLISADGTAQIAEAAFNTKLEQFSQSGENVFGNITPAQVPEALGSIVSSVLGLNTIGKMKPTINLPSAPQYAVSYTPTQFQSIYNANTVKAACCTAIAIMAEGDLTGVVSDLRIAEKAFGLPQVPVTIVPVGLASPDVSGADEWDLDSQYSSGMAGTLKQLYLYDTTSLSDSDLALEFSRWATDDKARAASASLGECEAFPYLDGSMVVDDMTFLEAAAQGQTFFASAGDTGSFCPVSVVGVNGVPAGAPLVNYPAASPYVIGVGGTTLLTNADGNYDTEISWYAGGGGLSQFENAPYWQTAAVPLISAAATRGVPDIAYDADPESGATVYVNGAPEGVGGTSLASPLALGAWARIINTDWKVGFAGPALYSVYDGTGLIPSYPNGGYHDITVGANGFYAAGPGYDLNTGLGTIIVNQLTTALAQ
jgi:pseudomonalisin